MTAKKRTRTSSADASEGTVTSIGTSEPSNQIQTARAWEITYPNGATQVVYQESAAVRAQAEYGGSVKEITA